MAGAGEAFGADPSSVHPDRRGECRECLDAWQASWIAARADQPGGANPQANPSQPLPIFRYQFQIGKKVAEATLQISGLGQFEAHINGQNVTNAVLTPGWTDYRKRVFFDIYD